MIQVGVIGYGYWGPNLVRNFIEIPGSKVKAVSDLNSERLVLVRHRHPMIRITTQYRDLINDPDIDAIVIATPVSTHFELALQSLQAGKHVLVEKPMAMTSDQAKRLMEEAIRRNLVLMVDHTFVYTSAVSKIKELITQQELGEIYYYDSVRVNLGLFRHDMNVLWDLAVHDLSIMDYILPSKPLAVAAAGIRHIPGELEDIAYLTLFFEESLIAHIHVNWLSPVKVRLTLIGGSQKMIVYDDLEPAEKVKVYDKGITVLDSAESRYQMMIGYRQGDMWAPHLDMKEALWSEALHFVCCIEKGQLPITNGEAGLRVVRLLEAASRSMSEQCRVIPI
jgi:predicted dehydrogenase